MYLFNGGTYAFYGEGLYLTGENVTVHRQLLPEYPQYRQHADIEELAHGRGELRWELTPATITRSAPATRAFLRRSELAAITWPSIAPTAIPAPRPSTRSLSADLKKKTTYAPIVLANDFTAATTLSPVVQRDTDVPDRGFHYDPLDVVVNNRAIGTATVLLTNGVAVAVAGPSGFQLQPGAKLISEGSPRA